MMNRQKDNGKLIYDEQTHVLELMIPQLREKYIESSHKYTMAKYMSRDKEYIEACKKDLMDMQNIVQPFCDYKNITVDDFMLGIY